MNTRTPNRNRRGLGFKKEAIAGAYLKEQGLVIMEANFSCRMGEIDIVALDDPYLVFCEVKYRRKANSGYPESFVDFQKQRKICRAGDYFRIKHNIHQDVPIRYDVIALSPQEIRWHKNAFDHIFLK